MSNEEENNFHQEMEKNKECQICKSKKIPIADFSYAFQPIINIKAKDIFAHEALIRGVNGESAFSVLEKITPSNKYKFDQLCRVKAIEIASKIGIKSKISINFLPNAIYRPDVCIETTLQAAKNNKFPINKIIFETVEGEKIEDAKWLAEVFSEYKRIGFMTAIDDFGAGYAGLNLLSNFQPDIIKLDMELIRGIETKRPKQAIVSAIVKICSDLNIDLVAEGVETFEEFNCLESHGVQFMQGYYFCKPIFEGFLSSTEGIYPS